MFRFVLLVSATAGFSFASDESVARGKYLVEEIGKCQMCHTARTEAGELDKSKWLKGATLDFAPTGEIKGWHKTSPDLTSTGRLFSRWKEAGLVNFLETGKGPTGHPADPPMPTYTMKHEDAQAIVDYLKTLQ
jgi:hypothetical protein